ncbi:phosphonate C-P lyase system protein PhnH [Paraburkholderia fynbosensis]|uniref:Alpha-D-ribose 1-methylphosphonate 5-triphosphate synthase subunit PhnH n=1 Tax=Paraburkholderia fynbosensis TaxID=1200993 RepID=A0A6J5H0J1_9BURK|nr:phosphonate C-P lyase system protein PhnH [Paraburkholderia fynbosensis]CAB3809507.1 Alpha-D-ribose 1-methylphosphonate 5-triphosphate synthase subunit PhnH [Paraburkholderia fynbosensis]
MQSNNPSTGARDASAGIDLSTLMPGFADTIHDSQGVFRSLLDALSRPGKIVSIDAAVPNLTNRQQEIHVPLAAYAALLSLADYSTPVLLQHEHRSLSDALRFHTGAPVTRNCSEAVFAYLDDAFSMPSIGEFSLGEPETPETAAMLFIRVNSLTSGAPTTWRGPGIRESETVCVEGVPASFWGKRAQLASDFPCGVDCYFVHGGSVVGLPRTTRVEVI